MRRFAQLCALISWLSAPALAEDFSRYGGFLHSPEIPDLLVLNGPIARNASFDLRKALREHDGVKTLVLVSSGGDVFAGLELSAIIHDHGLSTLIPPGADCASACAFLFVAGKARRPMAGSGCTSSPPAARWRGRRPRPAPKAWRGRYLIS